MIYIMESIQLIIGSLEDWLKKLEYIEHNQPVIFQLQKRVNKYLLRLESREITPVIEQLKYIGSVYDELLNVIILNYNRREIIRCILKLHGLIDEDLITDILLYL